MNFIVLQMVTVQLQRIGNGSKEDGIRDEEGEALWRR
jgi:hypothetical protein